MTFAADNETALPEQTTEASFDLLELFLNAFAGAGNQEVSETDTLVNYACA